MNFDNPVEFIKTLKSEHRAIVAIIHEIDSQSDGSYDLKNSVNSLNKVTDILFDHLEKEDKQLYPTLINNKDTSSIAKKYYYDMERLSCIAVDFFKRYCTNKEGLKIFIEDFINSYSIFKGLLKVRIQREETELYPAFILLQSGVMYSEVLNFVQEQETKINSKPKNVMLLGQDENCKSALALALEMHGYQVYSEKSTDLVTKHLQTNAPDLILIDATKSNKELIDLVAHLKSQMQQGAQVVGYSNIETNKPSEDLSKNLDDFLTKPASNIEEFSKKIGQLLKS